MRWALVLGLLTLTACNTIAGVGADISAGAETVEGMF
jgi:predicted small secreted protein